MPVSTSRATVIDVGRPLETPDAARAWLASAGEGDLAAGLEVLDRTLYAFRLVSADPDINPIPRDQLLTARVGYGAGEQVADGLWADARELRLPRRRVSRAKVLAPQARLAAVMNGREPALACEELVLRARSDLDHGRHREAALQLLVALDAALAELALDTHGPALEQRLAELRDRRGAVGAAAQAALSGPLTPEQSEAVAFTVGRIEAALRARVVASA